MEVRKCCKLPFATICLRSLKTFQGICAYINEHELDAAVSEFSHPDALLLASEKTPFDLYLLDIVMPMLNGIGVGRELRQRHSSAQIVFLTTSDEFAVEAFSLRAAHYLIKPFSDNQFNEAMERTWEALHFTEPKTLPVRLEGGELRNVDIDEINYVESRGHAANFHLKSFVCTETQRSLSRIYEELEKLLPGQFIQPYKGYIVNQRAIVSIEAAGILLQCGARIPIPRGTLRQLQTQYVAWRFDRKGVGA